MSDATMHSNESERVTRRGDAVGFGPELEANRSFGGFHEASSTSAGPVMRRCDRLQPGEGVGHDRSGGSSPRFCAK